MACDLVASIPASDFWRLSHCRKINHIQEENCQKPIAVGDELAAEPSCRVKYEHWPDPRGFWPELQNNLKPVACCGHGLLKVSNKVRKKTPTSSSEESAKCFQDLDCPRGKS